MKKFENSSSDDCQVSLAEGTARARAGEVSCPVGHMSHVPRGGVSWSGPCTVSSNASWVMVSCGPLPLDRMTDRHD